MDACLELLLPGLVQLTGLEQRDVSFTWGGVSHTQTGVRFYWGRYVEIVQTPIPAHLRRFLAPKDVTGNWNAFSIRGEGLDLLQEEVNGTDINWQGKSLDQLLRLLLSQYREWVFVFELHCDQIDHVYSTSVDECLDRFRENLRRDASIEGFVATSSL